MFKRFWHWLTRCNHKYLPVEEGRTWVRAGSRGKIIRTEFRYQCCRCESYTPWIKRRYHAAWIAKHNPCWENGKYDRRKD